MSKDNYIWVLAAPGRLVPVGGPTRKRFSDEIPKRVELTSFIRRRLRDGDLMKVARPPKPASGDSAKTARKERG